MQWAARGIGLSAALLGVACAAIAGLEPVEPQPQDPELDAGPEVRDGSTSDVKADAREGPSCKQSGERGCHEAADCCNGQCREDGVCVEACQMPPPADGTCPLDGDPDCCVGFWCGGGSLARATCAPCVPAEKPVEKDHFGMPTPRSCCSRKARNGICQ